MGIPLPFRIPILLLLSSAVFAQSLPEREFGEPWNTAGIGARAIGMGCAYTAVSDDIAGAYWNPGGLVKMRDTQLGIMTGSAYTARSKDFGNQLEYWQENGKFGDVFNLFWQNIASVGFITTAFKPWATGFMTVRAFHPESLVPWQENYFQGVFVMPLNAAKTGGLGINVKFLVNDWQYNKNYKEYLRLVHKVAYPSESSMTFEPVSGWAIDAGGIYLIPLPVRDRFRQFSIGLMARNLVGRKKVGNLETDIPRQAQIGFAFTFDDLIPRERSIISTDIHQALMAQLGKNSMQFRMGFEQWFFQNYGALRFGYATPMPPYDPVYVTSNYLFQGIPIWTMGASVMLMDLQVDIAVTFPSQKQEAREGPAPENEIRYIPPSSDILAVDSTRMYLQATYHWRSPTPPPFARVTVEPLVFSPRKGEVAVFTIDYRDESGIESWALEIKNSARVPVRTFASKGAPPLRLVWDGLDDRFNLASDDDYTYSMRIRNRDGVETVTPQQAFRIFTPEEQKSGGDWTLLYKLLEEQQKKEGEDKEKMRTLIDERMKERKGGALPAVGEGALPGGGAVPALPGGEGTAPAEREQPQSATVSEGSGILPPGGVSYRGVAPEQILRVQVPATGGQGDQMVLEYSTQRYILKYLVKELKSLTEQSFGAVGDRASVFMVQARYGNHLMVVETPMEVARALRNGRIDDRQWARQARFTLDGTPVQPILD